LCRFISWQFIYDLRHDCTIINHKKLKKNKKNLLMLAKKVTIKLRILARESLFNRSITQYK